tara:strand:- start:881 stop:1078 length:198 start_codon:yes stop_codon:yes gene_type:complete
MLERVDLGLRIVNEPSPPNLPFLATFDPIEPLAVWATLAVGVGGGGGGGGGTGSGIFGLPIILLI